MHAVDLEVTVTPVVDPLCPVIDEFPCLGTACIDAGARPARVMEWRAVGVFRENIMIKVRVAKVSRERHGFTISSWAAPKGTARSWGPFPKKG